MKKKKQLKKRIILSAILVIAASYLIPIGIYKEKFMANTSINGMDVSNQYFANVEEILEDTYVSDYLFQVNGRNGSIESIKGEPAWLSVHYDLEEIKKEQNLFKWPIYLIRKHEYSIKPEVEIDDQKLMERIRSLKCMDDGAMQEPVNAYISAYENGVGYKIIDDVKGTALDKEKASSMILQEMKSGGDSVDLESCYLSADITSDSESLKEMLDRLNQVAASEIHYQFDGRVVILDADTFHEWILTDDTGNLTIDREKAINYVSDLATETDTAYTQREFSTTSGGKVSVTGPYGYRIAKEDETTQLCADLLSGQVVERKPVYVREGASRNGDDYGTTYVEIDLTNQKVYLYVNGNLVKSSSCVTGNVSKGHTTPPGIYPMTYKQLDAVLRGPGYASPVKYWMPFNGGIGLHDASWRSSFGGTIYKTNGSHGCVNLPYEMAKTIYENAYAGMPVICYN